MGRSAIKTVATAVEVSTFIDQVEHPGRRADARVLVDLMTRLTGAPATMWGPSIIGFGRYHYRYESGHEGDMCVAGFSPRKTELVVYLVPGFAEQAERLARLGPCRTGKSCLYIRRLADVDMAVLEQMITQSLVAMAPQRTA